MTEASDRNERRKRGMTQKIPLSSKTRVSYLLVEGERKKNKYFLSFNGQRKRIHNGFFFEGLITLTLRITVRCRLPRWLTWPLSACRAAPKSTLDLMILICGETIFPSHLFVNSSMLIHLISSKGTSQRIHNGHKIIILLCCRSLTMKMIMISSSLLSIMNDDDVNWDHETTFAQATTRH